MSPSTIQLNLNPSLGQPIYRQIMDGIKGLIAGGRLKPGERLPSIRDLASTLRINPSSAVKAYSELQHEGIISLDQGRGTFVSERPGLVSESREAILNREIEALLAKAQSLGFSQTEVLKRVRGLEPPPSPPPVKGRALTGRRTT